MTIVQIENVDAVENLDEILAVPGLTSIMIGPGDLSASMGYIGQRHHPEVLRCIEKIIIRARGTDVMVGLASGPEPERMIQWIEQGVQWVSLGNDTALMLLAADQVVGQIRDRLGWHPAAGGT
jgi:2-keto-3-deoxy-L-rhamnonate aldolase RhmA